MLRPEAAPSLGRCSCCPRHDFTIKLNWIGSAGRWTPRFSFASRCAYLSAFYGVRFGSQTALFRRNRCPSLKSYQSEQTLAFSGIFCKRHRRVLRRLCTNSYAGSRLVSFYRKVDGHLVATGCNWSSRNYVWAKAHALAAFVSAPPSIGVLNRPLCGFGAAQDE